MGTASAGPEYLFLESAGGSEATRLPLVAGRKLAAEDGDEDDVVDPENDLESAERQKADPSVGVSEPMHRADG